MVLCTHFLGEAGKLANRMAVLFHGRLHAFGTPAELAGELWTGMEVRVDLGAPAGADVLDALGRLAPVQQAVPTNTGALVHIHERGAVPAVVQACVGAGADVFAVEPREPTLEDVYFEIEARSAGQQPVASIASGSVRPEAPGIRDGGP